MIDSISGPGTPLGRLKGIVEFAEEHCPGYSPTEARPAEVALMDRFIELEAENEELKIANLPLYSDRMANLEREITALRKAITDAPHTPECASHRDFCSIPEHGRKACNCWKSRIPAGGLKV